VYEKNENIVARKIHDTFFLINIKQNYLDNKCVLYEINELGYFIWNTLGYTGNVEGIADKIIDKIDEPIERETIVNDVKGFLDILSVEGYVIKHGRN